MDPYARLHANFQKITMAPNSAVFGDQSFYPVQNLLYCFCASYTTFFVTHTYVHPLVLVSEGGTVHLHMWLADGSFRVIVSSRYIPDSWVVTF
jgi:hypothetical protein